MNKHTQLHNELQAAGATASEAKQLAIVAGKLHALKGRYGSAIQPARPSLWSRSIPLASAAVVFLVLGMATVAAAQSSLPGNILYPVKRASENVAVSLDPDYRATLMMRRADEVKMLIAQGASSKRVLATLAAYDSQAATYKAKNYAAFAYCKSSLQTASASANPTEKQQIASTLASLNDVD